MDIRCMNCGEPWDSYHIYQDIKGTEDEDDFEFGSQRYVIKKCPCCGDHVPTEKDKDRAARTEAMADLLGDDMDGAITMLEDHENGF